MAGRLCPQEFNSVKPGTAVADSATKTTLKQANAWLTWHVHLHTRLACTHTWHARLACTRALHARTKTLHTPCTHAHLQHARTYTLHAGLARTHALHAHTPPFTPFTHAHLHARLARTHAHLERMHVLHARKIPCTHALHARTPQARTHVNLAR